MSLNEVVSAERLHIGFFGMRNAGKSSLVNAVTGQQLSVVSDVRGTTTDPVKKSMELLPLGPVVIIDTPGMDDEGALGELRVQKAKLILAQTDIAVLVVDATLGLCEQDRELLSQLRQRRIPCVVALNKADLLTERSEPGENTLYVSAETGEGVHALKEALGDFARMSKKEKVLVSDLIEEEDIVVLVTPIDESAPKGRMILPQQMTMRDILDHRGVVILCQETELARTLRGLSEKPRLVITDSQVFAEVDAVTPADVPLTSFSILLARYKGGLKTLVRGAAMLSKLKDGDRVLVSEGCTHHRQCNDIGTVKIPKWIEEYAGARPEYTFTSGGEFPEDLSGYTLVIHCGGCMLNDAQMNYRINKCIEAGVPIVNYGIAIAQMHGILKRGLAPFPDIQSVLD